jgi:hypothetical protein
MTTAAPERVRPRLSLFSLDRPKLIELSKELRALLTADDRPAIAKLLGLGPQLAERLSQGERAVDWFLREESDPEATPFFASLRRVAKQRALELLWTSEEPSLEGRLRAFEPLREERAAAALVDKLLDPTRLPWFLVRPGATAGWLGEDHRAALAKDLRALIPALTPELVAFAHAVGDADGPIVVHDRL